MKSNKLLLGLFILFTLSFTGLRVDAIASTEAKLQFNKGVDYSKIGQLEEAAKHFKYAIDEDPNYIDAYYNLGQILVYLKQDETALAVFKQIILRKPDDYEAVYQTALLSNKLGQNDKAKMYLSLIPRDSLLGSKAKILEDKVDLALASNKYNIEDDDEITNTINKSEVVDVPKEQIQPVVEQSKVQEEKTVEQPKAKATKDVETPKIAEAPQKQVLTVKPEEKKIEEAKEPEIVKQTFITSNPKANSDGIYPNISSPTGIAATPDGNLFVAGFSDNTIYKILPDGKKVVYIKSEKIDGPIGIAVDGTNNLYIANYNKNNVLKVDSYGAITIFIENIPNPYCMNVIDGLLFVSSQGNNAIIRKKLL